MQSYELFFFNLIDNPGTSIKGVTAGGRGTDHQQYIPAALNFP